MSFCDEVAKTKSVDAVKKECIRKVEASANKSLMELNKAYREAEHDLNLLEKVGVISREEADETMEKMRFCYVKCGLNLQDEY